MKRILVLTPVYPAQDIPKTDTPVVHYFTREWVKMGYNVRVVHYVANFPKLLYMFAKPFKELIGAKAGFGIRTTPYEDCEYEIDGVYVKRIGIRKTRPHVLHPRKDITKAIDKTIQYCKDQEFIPDCIIGHWPNPQLEIMKVLKEEFHCKLCYVSHGDSISRLYKERTMDLLNEIDLLGFRCDTVKKEFFEEFDIKKPSFMCYSGIPASFLENVNEKDFSDIRNFIYVGTLIKRKFPSVVVEALAKAYNNESFSIKYVGTGAETQHIEKVAIKNNVKQNVHLLGRIDRKDVLKNVDKSQVFVMISRGEAFGLVYLEAMARGCITIASRGEGFDGIIKDGINGFLCEAGNADELAAIISKIRRMSNDSLQVISKNAKSTAESLTDVKAARYYIDAVEGMFKN